VNQRAVHERRVTQRQAIRHADHRAVAAFGHCANARKNAVRKVVLRRGQRDTHRIEDEILCALAHVRWNRIVREAAREFRKAL
jgi:hypothetical protein